MLGLSRPLISDIQNDKRPLTTEQQTTLEDYFASQQSADSIRINIPQKHLEKFKQVFLYVLQKVGAKPNVGEIIEFVYLEIDFKGNKATENSKRIEDFWHEKRETSQTTKMQ